MLQSSRLRTTLKTLVRFIATVMILPVAIPELLLRRLLKRDVLFNGQAELLSLVPGKTGIYLRSAYYRLLLRSSSAEVCINFGTVFTHSSAELASNVYIGANCRIGAATIGEYAMLADYVQVLSGGRQHGIEQSDLPYQLQSQQFSKVVLARNCWIGAGAIIMADIGENSVIGAGAVVNKPISANCVAVGIPAEVKRKLRPDSQTQQT